MTNQFKQTIIRALKDGITTASSESAKLEKRLPIVDGLFRNSVRRDIQTMDEWVVELNDALRWLEDSEFEAMRRLYNPRRAS